MKYTSRSVRKTTVKTFDVTDVEPVQIGYYKTPTLIDTLVVTYIEGSDGLRQSIYDLLGSNVLASGQVGQQRRSVSHWYADRLDWPRAVVDHNAPWAKAGQS